MRGSKNVKTYVDPVPIEVPIDQKISMRDEIMEQVRAMVAQERAEAEPPETLQEFWDLQEQDDEDPISSAYEVEDMQEEFLAPEADKPTEATPEPAESPGTEPQAEPPAAASTT